MPISKGPDNKARISSVHQNVHDGITFVTSYEFTSASTVDILISVGANKSLHIGGNINVSAASSIAVYEGTTVSDNGTALDVYNKNRNGSDSQDPSLFHTPTITLVGTKLYGAYIPGGKGGNALGGSDGGSPRDGSELILAKSTLYLIRVTGTSIDGSVNLEFYESDF